MPYFLLSAEATFSAAHTLPGVPRCERLHGHNWRVRVTVRIDDQTLDRRGIGVDFRVIERAAAEAVADFDHTYLNERDVFRDQPPTAERVAAVVSRRVSATLRDEAPAATVTEVEVWEKPEYRVSYRPE